MSCLDWWICWLAMGVATSWPANGLEVLPTVLTFLIVFFSEMVNAARKSMIETILATAGAWT